MSVVQAEGKMPSSPIPMYPEFEMVASVPLDTRTQDWQMAHGTWLTNNDARGHHNHHNLHHQL